MSVTEGLNTFMRATAKFKINVNQNENENKNATGEATYGEGRFAPPSQVPPLAFLFSFSF